PSQRELPPLFARDCQDVPGGARLERGQHEPHGRQLRRPDHPVLHRGLHRAGAGQGMPLLLQPGAAALASPRTERRTLRRPDRGRLPREPGRGRRVTGRVVTVVQARRGSTRLPDKVLLPLAGAPALVRQLYRVRSSALVGTVVVATTTERRDDTIE